MHWRWLSDFLGNVDVERTGIDRSSGVNSPNSLVAPKVHRIPPTQHLLVNQLQAMHSSRFASVFVQRCPSAPLFKCRPTYRPSTSASRLCTHEHRHSVTPGGKPQSTPRWHAVMLRRMTHSHVRLIQSNLTY